MMKSDSLLKSLKSAVWFILPGALISLLLCTLILGAGIIEMLMPVLLVFIFTVISFILSRIAFFANHAYNKYAISAAIVVITVILLHVF